MLLSPVRDFLGGLDSKESAPDPDSIPGSGKSPEEGNEWLPTLVFLPGKSHA